MAAQAAEPTGGDHTLSDLPIGTVDEDVVFHAKKDGNTIPVDVSETSLVLEGRKYQLSTVRDLTERYQSRLERLEAESHLRQSQKMQAVGRLAGGVAHDFNNILVAILCNADMLRTDRLSQSDSAEILGEIVEAGHRAASLTRQLLTFSKQKPKRLENLRLDEVIQNMSKLLTTTGGENVEITTKFADDLWNIQIDRDQAGQILLNLVVNASHAMPGGGKVVIETSNVDLDEKNAMRNAGVTPGQYVRLTVTDTGHGMSEDIAARVFEPFFTTKKVGEGTGLGLSTVYGIVNQADGNITVYSEKGVGTVFRVYLPRTHEGESIPDQPPPGLVNVHHEGKGETILIVEDDDIVRSLLLRMLGGHDYKVIAAADGEEAWKKSESFESKIDLLLTDVVLPKLSGKDLADRLKKQRPETHIVYMSGYTEQAVLLHGVIDSGSRFIEKPFTQEILLWHIRQALDR